MFDLALCSIVFQPIVNIKTLQVEYYEALIRHKYFSDIQKFVLLAEENQFICDVDLFVLEHCLSLVSKQNSLSIAINISMRTLEIFGFRIAQRLLNYTHSNLIIIEITESRDFYDSEKVSNFVQLIKQTNARISIDDFADGFSDKQRVITFKPHILKISIQKPSDVIQEAVNLANELGAALVFERIESQDELVTSRRTGASHGQGYFFGHPTIFISENKN